MNNKYGLSFIVSSSPNDAVFAQRIMDTANTTRNGSVVFQPMAVEASFALNYMFNNDGFYNVFSAGKPFASPCPLYREEQQLTGFASALFDKKNSIYSVSHMYTVPSPHYSGTALLENLVIDARSRKAKTIRIWAENKTASEHYIERGFKPYMRDKDNKMNQRYLELKDKNFEKSLKEWKKISQTPYESKQSPKSTIAPTFNG